MFYHKKGFKFVRSEDRRLAGRVDQRRDQQEAEGVAV